MQNEKLISIIIAIMVAGVVSGLLVISYSDEIMNQISPSDDDAVEDDTTPEEDVDLTILPLDRITTFERNLSYEYVYEMSKELVDTFIFYLSQYGVEIDFSVNDYAGESINYEVEIVEIYNVSLGAEEVLDENYTIKLGDCIDIHYIETLASTGEIIYATYENSTNKSGGTPYPMFLSLDVTEYPPEGYDSYYQHAVTGLMQDVVGMKKGESTVIGPIAPEDAYGLKPEIGDAIYASADLLGEEVNLEFSDIKYNVSLTSTLLEYELAYNVDFEDPNNIYYMKDKNVYLGRETTIYPSWENSTVITKLNDTYFWEYTTPPADKLESITWIDPAGGFSYWESATDVSLNETHITVTHNPEVGATFTIPGNEMVPDTVYTVVNLTADTINISYPTPGS